MKGNLERKKAWKATVEKGGVVADLCNLIISNLFNKSVYLK